MTIFEITNRLDSRITWQALFERELFVSTSSSEIHDREVIKDYFNTLRMHQKSGTSAGAYNIYTMDCGYYMRDRQLDITLHLIDGVGHSVVIQYNNVLSNNFICVHTNLIDLKSQFEILLEKIYHNRVGKKYGL